MDYDTELTAILKAQGLFISQIRIAILVSKGLSNEEVANQLFKHERDIKRALFFIYKQMHLKSRAQLIVWCLSVTKNHAFAQYKGGAV